MSSHMECARPGLWSALGTLVIVAVIVQLAIYTLGSGVGHLDSSPSLSPTSCRILRKVPNLLREASISSLKNCHDINNNNYLNKIVY